MTKTQTTIAALSLAFLAVIAGLFISVRSQLKLMQQIQNGTSITLRQIQQEVSESPVEALLDIRPKPSMRRRPRRERRSVRTITLSNGDSIRPVANPGLADPDGPASDLNHWSCSFFSVGVAVYHGHIVTNTSGYVTGWIEDDVHLYPYESISSIEFEPVK